MVIIRYYLVDSENVNDNWLMLFDMAEETDEIIVFYTKKSPHMSYMSVIKLIENDQRKIKFEECFEGNNALDFQLISYMGYLMGSDAAAKSNSSESHEDNEYIVMSNDTGYDPAIQFWKKKGFSVKRINVNFCKLALQKQKEVTYEVIEDPQPQDTVNNIDIDQKSKSVNDNITVQADIKSKSSSQPKGEVHIDTSESDVMYDFNKSEVDTFINCLGRDNLSALHETLVHVYGVKPGQEIYKTRKDKTYSFATEDLSRGEKVGHFTSIIFAHSDITDPGDFVDFLEKNRKKTKNLNGIRAAITKAFGDSNGMKYYSLFKPYFKIISALK